MGDPLQPIEIEIQGERASQLGEAGRRIERALAALGTDEDSLHEAATAVWYYMIIRESLGMYDHKAAFAIYGVPAQVMARVGVIRKTG